MENTNDYGWGLGSVVAMLLVVVAMLFVPLGMGMLAPPSIPMILVIPVLLVVMFIFMCHNSNSNP
ncbi:transmembrane protein [Artemisia annua]|uniref:Transmembrane protein n=1 Tax=Artemisia annua TaxID=35608 RepID=A0A2U1K8L6_ARTAN|nr:transmembrane protein [Artemisia annua]